MTTVALAASLHEVPVSVKVADSLQQQHVLYFLDYVLYFLDQNRMKKNVWCQRKQL